VTNYFHFSSKIGVAIGARFAILVSMKKTRKLRAQRGRLPDRSSELLINQRILWATRDELKAEILSQGEKVSGEIKAISSDIKKVSADVQRVIALVEEQENRNSAVLDGYQSLHDRQDDLRNEFGELRQTVLDFKKFSK